MAELRPYVEAEIAAEVGNPSQSIYEEATSN